MGKTIQYVVVVHGMGEARQNETILAVASRFAEARSGKIPWPPPSIVVPLGSATGQTGIDRNDGAQPDGLPWVEFSGIPAAPYPPTVDPFYAESSQSGDNLRFVNIHWNDLLARDWPFVGQPPDIWLDGLLGRLIRKDRHGAPRVPQWILETLRTLGETISLVHMITALRAKELDDVIFNKYLGDVQLYGEFPQTRGLAVRRFHERMDAVLEMHYAKNKDDKAEFTIIAHSLGTIMSADALMLAHANLLGYIRGGDDKIERSLSGVVKGYFTQGEIDKYRKLNEKFEATGQLSQEEGDWWVQETEFLCSPWIARVKAFVTLGSPIDKFLTIWWLNYAYLQDASSIVANPERIPLFNYCEEQDPVGHHLDVAYTAPAFAKVFEEKEDRVYTRYAVPGLAHVHYWDDLPLFKWILSQAIDRQNPAQALATQVNEPLWFVPGVYWWIVSINYLILPLAVAAAHFIALNWAWNAAGLNGMVLGAGMFVITWLLGRYILDLFIWWRQVLKAKAKIAEGGAFAADAQPTAEPMEEKHLLQADRGKVIPERESAVKDLLAAAIAGFRLLPLRWLLQWCMPKQPEEGAPASLDHRKRWIAERNQRAVVESRFRGLLLIIHLLSLFMLAMSVAWYLRCFAQLKDLARLAVLFFAASLMIGGWLIAVHGEIAGWQIGRRLGGFRVICGRRIRQPRNRDADRSRAPNHAPESDRLSTEGFFDCDAPGAVRMGIAAAIGMAWAWLYRGQLSVFWSIHPATSSALLWASVGVSGAIGYARARISRVKSLLARDANTTPVNFPDFFPPNSGVASEKPRTDSGDGSTELVQPANDDIEASEPLPTSETRADEAVVTDE